MTYELTRLVGSVYMPEVCDKAAVDDGEPVRQDKKLFQFSSGF